MPKSEFNVAGMRGGSESKARASVSLSRAGRTSRKAWDKYLGSVFRLISIGVATRGEQREREGGGGSPTRRDARVLRINKVDFGGERERRQRKKRKARHHSRIYTQRDVKINKKKCRNNFFIN